jgi:hypothetical protein
MSRDPSGNYSLPPVGATGLPINPVQPSTIITTDWARTTLNDLAVAMSDSLSRSGKGGMGANLVMNGYKVTNIGYATADSDAPQAVQVRDQAFTWLNPAVSEFTGNNYTATALLPVAPINGTAYLFLADRNNTGAMTLTVNGAAQLPILLHGAPVPPGLILAGAVIHVVYSNLTYRLVSIAPGTGTVNSIQSTDPAVLSVVNDTSTNIATLTPHTNIANGLVKLDGGVKVPIAQLPFTDLHYVGIWNATPGVVPSTAGINNGDFYIITIAGNLPLFRVTGGVGNTYTLQATPVIVGDAIILRVGSTDPNQPDGWYYDPASTTIVAASTVVMNPTPSLPAVSNAQVWMDQMDPIIAGKLDKVGGTLTGPVHSAPASTPSAADELVNKQYVDARVLSVGGVTSFNARQGAVTLISTDVTGALGYIPLPNSGNQTFNGELIINGNLHVSGGVQAQYFTPTYKLIDAAPASLQIDFFDGQSQRIGLTGNLVISGIINVPQGSIIRLTFYNLAGFTITWPANVSWPMGIVPTLDAGPGKIAVVTLEQFATPGTLLAAASIY